MALYLSASRAVLVRVTHSAGNCFFHGTLEHKMDAKNDVIPMRSFVTLGLIAITTHIGISSNAQQASTETGTFQRRYIEGTVSHYLMTGSNDGWHYTIHATDLVKRDSNGRYYEEIQWSDLMTNAHQTLTPASLALRQTVSPG